MQLIAGAAIASGTLVLLGWFTLPVRVALLVACGALLLWSYRSRGSLSFARLPSMRSLAIAAAATAAALILWSSGTTEPIRSPWSVVPAPFFFLYAMVAVAAAAGPASAIMVALSLASAVAIFVYPIGFGFDHFIHAAAERIIATTGALSPPPLFYSAHYGLTALLADLLPWVDAALADRLLVPFLTLLLVPIAIRAFRTVLPERAALLGASSLIIVPFLPLAVSTPQALANVFAVAVVIALLIGDIKTAAIAAVASTFAQPMTGIIAFAVVAVAFATQRGWRLIGAIAAVLGATGIPIGFAIASRVVPQLDVAIAFAPIAALQRLGYALLPALAFTAADFATADALAIARVLLPVLWIGLVIAGAMRLFAWKPEENYSLIRSNRRMVHGALILAPIIALLAAAVIAVTVTIPTQLGEEQSQFPLRLVQLAALLATPLAGIGIGSVLARVRGRLPSAAMPIALSAVATFTLLLAYPRDDAQSRSGLWSVSASDITAVRAIAADAGDAPYVVLANQMLGAAAVREFGFRPAHRLADGREILAFPLPAGGPIARQFWNYVSETPTREPIDAAMDLVGTDRAYLVLHDYWRGYEAIAAATAAVADTELAPIRHLRIFKFSRHPSSAS